MKIKPEPFALASALTAAVLWLLCSLLLFIMPILVTKMSGHMVHANLGDVNWVLSLTGVLVGLICWAIFAAIVGWILANFYNLLGGK